MQYAPITAEVFEALPRLRLVSRYGVGVDAVDTDAALRTWRLGVQRAGLRHRGGALHAVAMLLALLRNVGGHDRECVPGTGTTTSAGSCVRPAP